MRRLSKNQAYAKHLNCDGESMIMESFVGKERLCLIHLRVIAFCSLLASTWVGHHVESYLLAFYLYFSVFKFPILEQANNQHDVYHLGLSTTTLASLKVWTHVFARMHTHLYI